MPKSRRDRLITLSQVEPKGRENKSELISQIQDAVGQYNKVYVFEVHNTRNTLVKRLRERLDGRFFQGKRKVMRVALGNSEEEEQERGLHALSAHLVGERGILCTNLARKAVDAHFAQYLAPEFARPGAEAPRDFVVAEGPLPQFSHALQPRLVQLGLPCRLDNGVVTLDAEYTVCSAGDELTPEQAKLLKLFGQKMAEFSVELVAVWTRKSGKVKKF